MAARGGRSARGPARTARFCCVPRNGRAGCLERALGKVALGLGTGRRARGVGEHLVSGTTRGAGLLIGGALGNVVDRLLYGAVADFINMSCCCISNPYAFNVADIAIFIGAFGVVLWGGTKKAA